MRNSVAFLIILLLFLPYLSLQGSGTEIQEVEDITGPKAGEPDIDIVITSSGHRAYVEPGDDGIVTVRGTIVAEIPWSPNIQYLVVQLQAHAGGWPVSVPPALTFSQAQKQQSFTMSVQVPIETPPEESRDLVISGTWQYSPGTQSGTTETEYVHIEVMPFVHLGIDWDVGNITLYLDEFSDFEVEIINHGTMTSNVYLSCSSDSGEVDIELSESYVEIKPHQRKKVEVEFGQSSGSQGHHKITFYAEDPENSRQGPVQGSFSLFTKEKTFSVSSIPYLVPGAIIFLIILLIVIFFIVYRGRNSKSDEIEYVEIPDTI